MTEIKYKLVDGEPACNSEYCPRFETCIYCLVGVADCIPGLRQQRDEARHNLCMAVQEGDDGEWTYLNEAKVRGWGYLYE